MIEPLQLTTLFGLGFILGLKHALDVDHVAAVSTIVSQTKNFRKSSLAGAIWGVGHTAALFLFGLAILVFKLTMPVKLALFFEFMAGVVLVVLGIDALRKIIKEKVHLHEHQHDESFHTHIHPHKESLSHNHIHKFFVVGMIHGLAGSAALILLVLTAVKSIFQGLLYILIFGFGSIVGMFIVSGIIALPFLLSAKFIKVINATKIFMGAASIVLGLIIMYEIGLTMA